MGGLGRVGALGEVQEPEGPDDGAHLPRGGRYPVARRAEPGGVDLGGDDEGGGVGPEVGEEEGERVHDDEAGLVALARPVVVGHGEADHEGGHHEEAHELDLEAADGVDEGDGEPVARHGAAERDQDLGPRDVEQLVQRAHRRRRRDPPDGAEDVLLEQVLRVVGDVQEEPRRRGADEVEPVPAHELPGEEAERRRRCVGLDGNHGLQIAGLLLGDLHVEHLGHVGRRGDLHVEHVGHVGRGALGVLGD
uniref:Uncharacterized protein n=1 Tax=Triticum urartu TaxID=4572 RepID=A0A8R7RCY2_TRIUA